MDMSEGHRAARDPRDDGVQRVECRAWVEAALLLLLRRCPAAVLVEVGRMVVPQDADQHLRHNLPAHRPEEMAAGFVWGVGQAIGARRPSAGEFGLLQDVEPKRGPEGERLFKRLLAADLFLLFRSG